MKKIIPFFFLICISQHLTSAVRYVKYNASGANNGTSWFNAYTDLQTAINASVSGDQVWVAMGTYKPTNTTNRALSFSMKAGVQIYGGFIGNETLLSQRNWQSNSTILSGDIGVIGDKNDNSIIVIKNDNNGVNNTAVLDGFTVKDGNYNFASDPNPISKKKGGSAMFNYHTTPTIRNCTFEDHWSASAGRQYYIRSYENTPANELSESLVVDNCIFIGDKNNGQYQGMSAIGIDHNLSISNSSFKNFVGTSMGQKYANDGIDFHKDGQDITRSPVNILVKQCSFFNTLITIPECPPLKIVTLEESSLFSFRENFFIPIIARSTSSDCTNDVNNITLNVKNSTIWSPCNVSNPIGVPAPNSNVNYSNVSIYSGASNSISNQAHFKILNGDLSFLATDPGIDLGNNSGLFANDIQGNNRVFNSVVDMGSHEFQGVTQSKINAPTSVQRISTSSPNLATYQASGGGIGTYKWYNFYGELVGEGPQALLPVTGGGSGTRFYLRIENGNTASDFYCFTAFYCSSAAPVISSNSPICEGANLDLTADALAGASYNWSGPNGFSSSLQNPSILNASVLNSGTYNLIRTNAAGCSSSLISTNVTINPSNAANNTTSNATICENQTKNLSATPVGGSWSVVSGGGNIVGSVYTPVSTGIKIIRYTFNAGSCGGITTSDVSFAVEALPTPSISGTNTICAGSSSTFTASGGTSYVWSTGATTASISVSTAGTYTVTATNAAGCTATASHTLTVNANPAASISGTNTICAGASSTFTASGGTSYVWSTGATTAAITVSTAGTYTVTATNAAGCTATASRTLTVNANPAASISGTNTICAGASSTFTASGGTSYVWSTGATTAAISVSTAGTYTVTATNAAGCTATASRTLTVNANPAASISGTNTICAGASSTFTASGGTSYVWSTGATTAAISVSTAGTYTVTATNAAGCTATASRTLTVNANPAASISGTNTICAGASSTFTASGGTSYVWSTGATTAAISVSTAGTYTVTATNAAGCTATASRTLTVNANPAVSLSKTDVSTNGGSNGTATASATGGTTPYTYLWSNGASTAAISGLTAGTYNVTVSDALGCTTTGSVVVNQPACGGFSASISSSSNVNCFGGATGSATAQANGGTAPFTYAWSNGASTALISALAAGSYTVTITDGVSCSATASVTITQPASALSATTSKTDVTTSGGSNGTATASATGGTTPYTYLWSNGATTAAISGLTAGTYSVTITDALGCTTTGSVVVNQPACGGFSASIASSSNVSCFGGSTGSATAQGNGGTAPFTYAWSNGASTASISALAAGSYAVTITDGVSCSATASVTISQPAAALAASLSKTDVTTNGGSNGTASASASGGTTPYTYLWSNGASTAAISGLTAGTYNVTITDALGCTTTGSVVVNQPACGGFSASIASSSNVNCFGSATGSATAQANGGTAPFTYAWSNGASTASISALAAGFYTVTITDGVSCSATASVTITQPASALSATTSKTDVTTSGGNDGTASTSASGGTTPYTYVWSNGASTAAISGLVAGTYTVTVTDANDCYTSSSIIINQPACGGFSASISSSSNVNCFGGATGSATAQANGGTAPFTYAWSNGASTALISALAAGSYTVTITDGVSCSATASVTISQPAAALSATTSKTNVTTNGGNDGTASASASGGTTPYTYVWSNGASTAAISGLTAGTYSVTITDALGCTTTGSVVVNQPACGGFSASIASSSNVNCFGSATGSATAQANGGTAPFTYAWSNGASTALISALAAGSYTVTITDGVSCSATASVTISQPAAALAASLSKTDVTTNGGGNGTASASASGGTTPYTYVWSNGASTAAISGLTAGTYSVTITDALGCTTTGSVVVNQPACGGFSASIASSNNVNCFGNATGSATAAPTGGTAPFTYAWSNGASTASISTLAAGSYTVTVSDAISCSATASVTITQPSAALSLNTSTTDASCHGGSNGTATALPMGGTAPYGYGWSSGSTDSIATGLSVGTYSLTLTDALGCSATASLVSVGNPTSMQSLQATTQPNCFGQASGTASVLVSGGTPPYTFNWNLSGVGVVNSSPGSSTASNLPAGSYSVTTTDAQGCQASNLLVVVDPPLLVVQNSSSTPEDCGLLNGAVLDTAFGGTQPLSFLWLESGQTTLLNQNLMAGTHTLVVTDANGCTDTLVTPISSIYNASISAALPSTNYMCASDSASLSVSSNGTITSYVWSTTQTTDSIWVNPTVLENQYSVTISNGRCTATDSMVLDVKPLPTLSVVGDTVLCEQSQGSLSAITNATSYLWSTGDTTKSISFSASDSLARIMVTVTDDFGCTTNNGAHPITPEVHQKPTAHFDTLPRGPYKDEVVFVDSSYSAITSHLWDFGDGWTTDMPSPKHLYAETGRFTVTLEVSNLFGCTDTAKMEIIVPEYIQIPNVFTPNGDGFNDEFIIPSTGLKDFELVIKNRWGEVVFTASSTRLGWDGTSQSGQQMPVGTYYYLLKAIGKEDYSRQGTVTLLRD